MPWSWVISPPTSVHFSCGSTPSISATFGHGAPQPPGGLGTSMVRRSTTERLQRTIESVQPCPSLADVERLSKVQRSEHDTSLR